MLAWLDTLIAWTLVHLKAPTQVTCAHCQRSLWPETQALGFRFYPATFRPGEPHILHHFSFPSTPQFVFLYHRTRPPTLPPKSFPTLPTFASACRLCEGARIITPVRLSSTPSQRFSSNESANQSPRTNRHDHLNPRLCFYASAKGRES